MIDDVVIIAAGAGSRLQELGLSKPLVPVAGHSLISRAIKSAFAAGVRRAVVVTGHEAAAVEAHLAELRAAHGWNIATLYNADYLSPNGRSVLRARELVSGPFFLAMCDHLAEPAIYARLLAAEVPDHCVALGIDRRLDNPFVDLDDVTRVALHGDLIRDIGKGIAHYDAYDTGIFRASPALMDAVEISGRGDGDWSISGGMRQLAARGCAIGVDVGDACWIDVDNPRMHRMAEDWIRAGAGAAS